MFRVIVHPPYLSLSSSSHNTVGVPVEYGQAVHWYLLAAEQGFDKAQNNVGCTYEHGQGVAQDDSLAMRWYLRAAEQRNALAQYNIACLNREVRGVAQDLIKR